MEMEQDENRKQNLFRQKTKHQKIPISTKMLKANFLKQFCLDFYSVISDKNTVLLRIMARINYL